MGLGSKTWKCLKQDIGKWAFLVGGRLDAIGGILPVCNIWAKLGCWFRADVTQICSHGCYTEVFQRNIWAFFSRNICAKWKCSVMCNDWMNRKTYRRFNEYCVMPYAVLNAAPPFQNSVFRDKSRLVRTSKFGVIFEPCQKHSNATNPWNYFQPSCSCPLYPP